MNRKERLEEVFQRRAADRTPTLGGWIACPEHICRITGVTLDEYWESPKKHSVDAYRELQCDGLVDILVPKSREDFRIVDANTYVSATHGYSLEEAVERIEALPSPERIEADFDLDRQYGSFKERLLSNQELCGDIVYMPAQWSAGAKVNWYDDFGYENFFLIAGLFPELAIRLFRIGGAMGLCRSRLVARAVREGIYPHALLMGEDICDQRGPMISPELLREHYIPQLARGLEPLLEVGCRPVWHSDGDVRPLIDMLIEAGIEGFQGYQPECGVTLELLAEKRTRDGNPLLLFGPMAVTTELPVLTPAEVRERVRQAIATCRGKADLVLFTSNTINPDVPLENVCAMYNAVRGA
jgi:hypothetical protein